MSDLIAPEVVTLDEDGTSEPMFVPAGNWDYEIVADTYDVSAPIGLEFSGASDGAYVSVPDPWNDDADTARTAAGQRINHDHGGGWLRLNVPDIGDIEGLKLIVRSRI